MNVNSVAKHGGSYTWKADKIGIKLLRWNFVDIN
jgi:hypothetical protein